MSEFGEGRQYQRQEDAERIAQLEAENARLRTTASDATRCLNYERGRKEELLADLSRREMEVEGLRARLAVVTAEREAQAVRLSELLSNVMGDNERLRVTLAPFIAGNAVSSEIAEDMQFTQQAVELLMKKHRVEYFDASQHEPDPVNATQSQRVLDLVVEDLEARAEAGKQKYGTYLMTHNGRRALIDAYQEALDLVMYLRQCIAEAQGEVKA